MNALYTAIRQYSPLLLAFIAGAILSGIFFHWQGSRSAGRLDSRYTLEHTRATEIVGQLTAELVRERERNRELREHNDQARTIAGGLTASVERNVTNLQEAIGLIGEIRTKLKVLADFYADSSAGSSSHQR